MMKSNFLNLPSLAAGDARRHVPFRSIINKHFSILFVLVFVFSILFSYVHPVAASSLSNIPESDNWQFGQALDGYNSLTVDQKDIANFLTGSQGYVYAGLAHNNLNSSFNSYSDTINSIKDYGSKMWGDLSQSFTGSSLKNDLSSFFGNAVSYAKSRSESFQAWLGNIGIDYNSSSSFRIRFGKDQAQNNTDFYGSSGLYNWQFSSLVLDPIYLSSNFVYRQTSMNSNNNTNYYDYLNTLPLPHVRANSNENNYYNFILAHEIFSVYHNIFANLSNNSCYLCDDYGNSIPVENIVKVLFCYKYGGTESINHYSQYLYTTSISMTNYSSLKALYDVIVSGYVSFFTTNIQIALADFVSNLYVGSSWDDKSPWTADFDLNLTNNSNYVTVNSPINIVYIDLNGFIKDLYDNPSTIFDYVIDNTVDDNGDPVTTEDFNPVSKFPVLPSSGVNLSFDLFNPLTKEGGYISYLWYMTKPLVLYTKDFVNTMVFDSELGFENTGPGIIVYGVISLGLIGGLVVKCLL